MENARKDSTYHVSRTAPDRVAALRVLRGEAVQRKPVLSTARPPISSWLRVLGIHPTSGALRLRSCTPIRWAESAGWFARTPCAWLPVRARSSMGQSTSRSSRQLLWKWQKTWAASRNSANGKAEWEEGSCHRRRSGRAGRGSCPGADGLRGGYLRSQ